MYDLIKFMSTNLYFIGWVLLALVLLKISIGKPLWRQRGFFLLLAIWIIGIRPVADLATLPLTTAYEIPNLEELKAQGVKHVVVLSGAGREAKDKQINSQSLAFSSMNRFLSGLEICSKLGDDCVIVFSGGSEEHKTAVEMSKVARTLQPAREMYFEIKSHQTEDHPINIKPFIKDYPFVLVTSKTHMVRSVSVFHKANLHPIPYPVPYYQNRSYRIYDFFPSVGNIGKLENALYEYLGQILYFFK